MPIGGGGAIPICFIELDDDLWLYEGVYQYQKHKTHARTIPKDAPIKAHPQTGTPETVSLKETSLLRPLLPFFFESPSTVEMQIDVQLKSPAVRIFRITASQGCLSHSPGAAIAVWTINVRKQSRRRSQSLKAEEEDRVLPMKRWAIATVRVS